ncbi:hypothetical protein [Lacinutrix undariae]
MLFGLSTLNFSCQKEDVSINETSNNSVSTNEIISYNDFINAKSVNKNLLQEAIGDLNSLKSSTHRSLENNTFVVDTTLIGNVQHESGYVSYTFRVVSDPEANLLQNIMLSQYADGTEMNYLIEYKTDVPVGEILNGTTNQHLTEYRVTKLIDPQLSYASRGLSGSWDCVDVVSITSGECSFTAGSDKKEYADHPGCYEPDQITPRTFMTITVTEECEFVGGGIGADTGSDTGGFTPIGGGPGGETGNPAAGDDDTPCEENGFTTTIDDGNGGCISGEGVVMEFPGMEEEGCNDTQEYLMELFANTTIRSYMNDFKTGISSASGNFKEDGARFSKSGDDLYIPRNPSIRNGNSIDYTPNYLGNETVSMHIHQQVYYDMIISSNPFFNAPVPSDDDIVEVMKNIKHINQTNPSLVSEVVQIVMTEAGLFAILIDKESALSALNTFETPKALKKFKNKFSRRVLKEWNKVNQNAGEICDEDCLRDTVDRYKLFMKETKIGGNVLNSKVLEAVFDENGQLIDWICN